MSDLSANRVKGSRAGRGSNAGDLPFRVIFLFAFLASLVVSGYHRRRARQTTGAIPRRAEGRLALALRGAAGLTLFVSFVLYPFAPGRLAWATLRLPRWLRWAAASLAIAGLPLLWWMFASIGSNISETVLTKSDHRLVTAGPYKWIRHPLYAFSLLEFLSLALLASNWFLISLVLAGTAIFRFVVIPSEERNLVRAFGERYEEYRKGTGTLFPRMPLPALRARIDGGHTAIEHGPVQPQPV